MGHIQTYGRWRGKIMNKRKVLTTIMGAIMATAISGQVAAAETINIDLLYKNAYNATQKALTIKTQSYINEARVEIKKLPKNLDWAIGEFSKQVDTVQHPILVRIVNSIKIAENNPIQDNINTAKASIPAELNPIFKNSYSSAIDTIQQKVQANALNLVKKAEKERTIYDVIEATLALADIQESTSKAIVNWADTVMLRLEPIVLKRAATSETYEVGKDIAAGEYLVVSNGMLSYLECASDNTGKFTSITFADFIIEGSSSYVEVEDGEYLTIEDAEIYSIEEAPSKEPTDGVYRDGMYKVGRDIPAGEYKLLVTGPYHIGMYDLWAESRYTDSNMISFDILSSDTTITVKEGQYLRISGLEIHR